MMGVTLTPGVGVGGDGAVEQGSDKRVWVGASVRTSAAEGAACGRLFSKETARAAQGRCLPSILMSA